VSGGVREGEAETGAEAGAFAFEVVANEGEFGSERDRLAVSAGQGAAEEVGELAEDALGFGGLVRDDGRDRVEGIEEEVGTDLGFEGAGLGAGFGELVARAAVVGMRERRRPRKPMNRRRSVVSGRPMPRRWTAASSMRRAATRPAAARRPRIQGWRL
jgi:hypothetical protein